MGIEEWSDDIILVDLPLEPRMFDELDDAVRMIREKDGCNVVLNFSGINIITEPGIARLSRLNELLMKYKFSLVLCNVSRKIKKIFASNKLPFLRITDGKAHAITSLRAE